MTVYRGLYSIVSQETKNGVSFDFGIHSMRDHLLISAVVAHDNTDGIRIGELLFLIYFPIA